MNILMQAKNDSQCGAAKDKAKQTADDLEMALSDKNSQKFNKVRGAMSSHGEGQHFSKATK